MADRGDARRPRRGGQLGVALGVRLRGQRDDVGELGDRLEVAELGEPGEAERVQAVAGEQREVGVVGAHDAAVAVVLEVALADRLDEQRVVVLAPGGARAGRGRRAEARRRPAPASATASASRPPLGAQRAPAEVGERVHQAISANAAAAASSVRVDVLGRVGERGEPGLELRRRRVDAAREQRPAPGGVGLEVAGRRAGVVADGLASEKKTVSRPGV